jgi:hypothetical protein
LVRNSGRSTVFEACLAGALRFVVFWSIQTAMKVSQKSEISNGGNVMWGMMLGTKIVKMYV